MTGSQRERPPAHTTGVTEIWNRIPRRGEVRRLPYGLQALVILVALGALFLTPVGAFLRILPIDHAQGLVRLMRRQATLDERLNIRTGGDYEAIRVIESETPPDAVILFSDRKEGPSCLSAYGAKHQDWATYFLYPRKILYLHQREHPLFEQAKWLLVDTPSSVSWIAPEVRGPAHYRPGHFAVVPFDMALYLSLMREGQIGSEYLPPMRQPAGEKP